MSGAGVRITLRLSVCMAVLMFSMTIGSRAGLPHSTVAGGHEKQAQGCGDRSQPAEAEE